MLHHHGGGVCLLFVLSRDVTSSSYVKYGTKITLRRGYTRFAWAGGIFSPVVLLCQFLVLAGNWFWFYIEYYLCT